ncbi:HTH-type transcriptional regulator PecS [Sinorhizobium fredii USDA 257]|uniref:HTH-type transcriptional regulator PecS n=2 Tax=Sinorhizobium/Ensifer group TaxID=227292 RepID=I3XFJ0_SINF2|nr:HTH-type transcriptional regulator PecS [Sinorhizobium fredii USDA 257]
METILTSRYRSIRAMTKARAAPPVRPWVHMKHGDQDHVDKILAQWRSERPELDISAMGPLGRLARLRAHIAREQETVFAEHDLTSASFDVLATLRRSGPPFQLSPGELLAATMVTSGTMTNRLDQLERAGLVERLDNPEDRRGVIIALTPEGLKRIDAAAAAHVANQQRLIAGLEPEERSALDALLRKFLATFE